MTSSELLRKLRRRGARVVAGRGKGGHVMVVLDDRRTFVPTSSAELKQGTLLGILKQLGLRLDDLE
ncbi:MAG: type II toxin-antitoxin system HicA family toxin [Bradyrhizobium sp.]